MLEDEARELLGCLLRHQPPDPWQPDDPSLQGSNPPKGYTQWLDINTNGTSRDEYVKKSGEKNASSSKWKGNEGVVPGAG